MENTSSSWDADDITAVWKICDIYMTELQLSNHFCWQEHVGRCG